MLRRTKNSSTSASIMARKVDTGASTTHTSSTNGVIITPGSTLVACISFRQSSGLGVASFTDNYNNVWVPAINSPFYGAGGSGPDEYGAVYYAQNVVTGADLTHTFTLTTTGACQATFMVMEIAGAPAAAVIEAQSSVLWNQVGPSTSHTGPSITTASGGFAVLCICGDEADRITTMPTYTLPSGWNGGGTAEYAGQASTGWGCNIYAKAITDPGTVTTSWTTSVSIWNSAWLLMIRPTVPKYTNSTSTIFSRYADTTAWSDSSKFMSYSSTYGGRIDSGVLSSNTSGQQGIYLSVDTNYISGGTIGSKITVKGSKGYDVGDDEVVPYIGINSGTNQWKGYSIRNGNGYLRITRIDAPSASFAGSSQVGLTTAMTIPPANNNTYELTFTPSSGSLKLYLNDTLIQTATDTTYTSNLASGFSVNWQNHGGTGITDYTPTGDVISACIGRNFSNTSVSANFGQNPGDMMWNSDGFVATKTCRVTHATINNPATGFDYNLRAVVYDENFRRIGNNLAQFTADGNYGLKSASFNEPFDIIKGKRYYLALASVWYSTTTRDGSTGVNTYRMGNAYNNIPTVLDITPSGGFGNDFNIQLSGYEIPAAMSIYANNAIRVTNIVEQIPAPANNYITTYYNSSGNTVSCTPTIGNYLICTIYTSVGGGNPYITSLTTNNGIPFTPVWGTYNNSSTIWSYTPSGYFAQQFYLPFVEAGVTSVTAAFNGGNPGEIGIAVSEYTGMINSAPIIYNRNSNTYIVNANSDIITSNSITVGTGPTLLYGVSINSADYSANAGSFWTDRHTPGTVPFCIEDRIVNSPIATYSATFTKYYLTSNGKYGSTIAAFNLDSPRTVFDFNETTGTLLYNINPAFYGYYISGLQTLNGNLVSTSFGGSIKAVYNKAFDYKQSAQVTKTNSKSTSYWVGVQQNDYLSDDGYTLMVRAYPTGAELYRRGSWVAGPYTVSMNAASNTVVAKIESIPQSNGSAIINSYFNGLQIGSYTDLEPLPLGKPAFWINTSSAAADDPVGQFVVVGEKTKSQLYANGTFVVGEYIEN